MKKKDQDDECENVEKKKNLMKNPNNEKHDEENEKKKDNKEEEFEKIFTHSMATWSGRGGGWW